MGDRVKIVAIGDSNTDRYYITNVLRALCYTDFLERILQDVPPGDPLIINRGKAGETTRDMYARFRNDVIEEHPDYAIIFGGTNDAGYIARVIDTGKSIPPGPCLGYLYSQLTSIEEIEEKLERGARIANWHLEEMCDAALTNGITPILCTIPPYKKIPHTKKGDESTQIDYGKRAISLMNRNMGTFCDLNTGDVKRADIYSALESSTEQGCMNPDFAADLIHINTRGHAKLAAVFFKVLTGADIEFFLQDGYMVSS